MEKINLKYRGCYQVEAPRPIKLQIPGWAGEENRHTDGDKPQPWHCTPFVEAATYGLELCYAFDTEFRVQMVDGKLSFIGDFDAEHTRIPNVPNPPFLSFAEGHFGMSSFLDIKVPDGYVLRIEPHPRFYTDDTHTVPLAIAGHLNTAMWTKFFFVVFKNPMPGQTYIFRKGEPYAQILILPRKTNYDVQLMTPMEQSKRSMLDEQVTKYAKQFVTNDWYDYLGHNFDDKYKILNNIYVKKGLSGVNQFLDSVIRKFHQGNGKKIKRRLFMVKNKNEKRKN